MKTRPVFESFSQFVDFLNYGDNLSLLETEGTGITITDFIEAFSTFFDSDAKNALKGYQTIVNTSPYYTNSKNKTALEAVKTRLKSLSTKISSEVAKSTKKKIDFSYWGTFAPKDGFNEIEITQYYNGKVKLGASFPGAGTNGLTANTWVPLEDVLTHINSMNLGGNTNTLWFPSVDDLEAKRKKFYIAEKTTPSIIYGSGSFGQIVVTDVTAGFNFGRISTDEDTEGSKIKILQVGTPPSGEGATAYALGEMYKHGTKEERNIQTVLKQYVVYTIVRMDPGMGDDIPKEYTKKEFVTVTVPGEIKTVPRSIKGTDKMFAAGSTELSKGMETSTMQAIDALLSEFSSIQSIVITGGASFEGGLEKNKTLVQGRAEKVKGLIDKYHPELKGKVTVNDTPEKFDKIQSTDDSSKYEEYRKVYFDVTGTIVGDSTTSTEERTVTVGEVAKMDKVTLAQYVLNLQFTIPSSED